MVPVEGSNISQNSVRDFEIPDFRFQRKIWDFFVNVNEVVKTAQMKVNVNLWVNPKTKKIVKNVLTANCRP